MAAAASDKKGIDIVTINMRKISGICDRFVIASGRSTTQVRAISDHIVKTLRGRGVRLKHIEGEREAAWILIDFGDVVGHICLEDVRKRYDLEELWADAPQERFKEPVSPAKRSGKARKKRVKKSVKRRVRKIANKPKKTNRKKSK